MHCEVDWHEIPLRKAATTKQMIVIIQELAILDSQLDSQSQQLATTQLTYDCSAEFNSFEFCEH